MRGLTFTLIRCLIKFSLIILPNMNLRQNAEKATYETSFMCSCSSGFASTSRASTRAGRSRSRWQAHPLSDLCFQLDCQADVSRLKNVLLWFGPSDQSAPALLLPLFNPNPKQVPVGRFGKYHLRLHIFTQSMPRRGKRQKSQFHFLNSIEVVYKSFIDKPSKFGAQLLWLDPQQKSMPLLKFDCSESDGSYGPIGDHVLVVFANRIKQRPLVQSLAFGNWFSSDSIGQSTSFDTLDERGWFELQTTLYPANDNPPGRWILHWNGKEFYPVNGPIKGNGIERRLPYP